MVKAVEKTGEDKVEKRGRKRLTDAEREARKYVPKGGSNRGRPKGQIKKKKWCNMNKEERVAYSAANATGKEE